MKLLFFMIIIGVHSSDYKTKETNIEVIIAKAYDLQASTEICKSIAIHPRAVMTAAECVNGFLPVDLIVEHLRYLLISDVTNIIIHPKYTECNGLYNFAILITENVITTENSIACLPDVTFLNTADLFFDDCSNKLITTKLSTEFSSDLSRCIFLPYPYRFQDIPSQICKLSYEETSNILQSRQVEMLICKPLDTNSQCLAYYFAHCTSTKLCSFYNEAVPFRHPRNYVYDVIPWIQNEIQKYVNGVPQVSACIFIIIACIVTHFSI